MTLGKEAVLQQQAAANKLQVCASNAALVKQSDDKLQMLAMTATFHILYTNAHSFDIMGPAANLHHNVKAMCVDLQDVKCGCYGQQSSSTKNNL